MITEKPVTNEDWSKLIFDHIRNIGLSIGVTIAGRQVSVSKVLLSPMLSQKWLDYIAVSAWLLGMGLIILNLHHAIDKLIEWGLRGWILLPVMLLLILLGIMTVTLVFLHGPSAA
jgi:hypothetical protein